MTKPAGTHFDSDDLHEVTGILESLMSVANDENYVEDQDSEKRVLLLGRPRSLRRWDTRWLQQSGFAVTMVDDAENALVAAESLEPCAVIAEAAFRDSSRLPVYLRLLDAEDLDVPVIVLSTSGSETRDALDNGAYDVARKPFDFRIVSRRVRQAAHIADSGAALEQTRHSLRSAVELADRVREQKRTSESFEPVTGLPNRSKFQELLRRSATSITSNGNVLLVCVVSLNRFNLITEALGVKQSDQVAFDTAGILRECLQSTADSVKLESGLRTASVARIDPGRFALLMTVSPDAAELDELGRVVMERLSAPMSVDGQTVYLSPCIGAAFYPTDVSELSQVLGKAESAMRDARSRGAQFCHHSKKVDKDIARKLQIENRLHAAIDNKELRLAYQPLVDIASSRIVGCEALLRWPQPDGSFLPPAEFVPIAEASGLMVSIGRFVLNSACRQMADWRERGMDPIRMSVNVSKCQLLDPGFPDVVRRCVETHGVDPGLLDLELSERGALSPETNVVSRLEALKELGVSLSIDDFGTGEAAIAYLKDLPLDVLKIDRSYIMELRSNGAESAITSAMVALGQKLNLTVVAEGVESNEQLAMLRGMGCDQYQGFYLSPAVSPDELASLVQKTP